MMISREAIRTAASIASLVTLLGSAVWFVAQLHARVNRLEEQVHVLTVAPTISNVGTKAQIANPIAQACAELAIKAAEEARTSGDVGTQITSERLLGQLGCVK